MIFLNRLQAGSRLGQVLIDLNLNLTTENGLVLGLPRGGIVVASAVADKLNLPLDIIVIKKIGAYLNPEYAIAAVGEHALVTNPNEPIDKEYVEAEAHAKRKEIREQLHFYRNHHPAPEIQNKTVIIVDDGIATGETMEAAIKEVMEYKPLSIIVAVPVGPKEAIERIKPFVKSVIYLEIPPIFFAVGEFYADFMTIPKEEVKKILARFWQK